ncbi:MAG TPA: hypothetical protein DGG94_19690, partial [Micromonosporaceae bacterium]|nr:hypothetical protein [Micromonosporaceae bacterium]
SELLLSRKPSRVVHRTHGFVNRLMSRRLRGNGFRRHGQLAHRVALVAVDLAAVDFAAVDLAAVVFFAAVLAGDLLAGAFFAAVGTSEVAALVTGAFLATGARLAIVFLAGAADRKRD